ncbi:hypothetical protein CDAR_472161 [Caerostris darwini]|uniref:Uncharacterized protein n=1 Tax=Caerostris darwini TaxID=1538125 RepID=A0AAV4VNS5_9ARAC|nr:hypothetical protein CDAR_472161 [Caerostris darwini]
MKKKRKTEKRKSIPKLFGRVVTGVRPQPIHHRLSCLTRSTNCPPSATQRDISTLPVPPLPDMQPPKDGGDGGQKSPSPDIQPPRDAEMGG